MLRPLGPKDAVKVDAAWTYRTEHSLSKISAMVASTRPGFAGHGVCLKSDPTGSAGDGELVAWCLVYPYGASGMLHTVEAHRRRGFAWLVSAATTVALSRRPAVTASNSAGPSTSVDQRDSFCYITHLTLYR